MPPVPVSMFRHGLLLLTYRPPHLLSLLSSVGSYLKAANTRISNTLYISLESGQRLTAGGTLGTSTSPLTQNAPTISDLLNLVPAIYVEAHKYAPRLDVRVLHHAHYRPTTVQATGTHVRQLAFTPEVIFTNEPLPTDGIGSYLHSHFNIPIGKYSIEQLKGGQSDPTTDHPSSPPKDARTYDYICLGGTFDNLHNGHKIMLSTAQLKCQKALTIGVTDRCMVRHKTLWELIDSPQERIRALRSYLLDTDPYLEYKTVPIEDSFGPAIVDATLQAIVVSEETVRGGAKINEIRQTKHMSPLEVEVIHLLNDGHRQNEAEEEKVSSSTLRLRKLGTLLKEPEPRPNLPSSPYIIGLTGMIASGKSSISEKLRKLGAGIVNVDLLAHQTYRNATMPAFKEIVANFGKEILDGEGNIDRRKLGAIVFEDDAKLAILNAIIWPKVGQLVEEEIRVLADKYSVIVLEIALLIEANWLHKVHQVWLSVLDEAEAVRRLQVRNRLSEEEARKRVASFVDMHEKVQHANVLFCTAWEEKVTWEQVKRAWAMIQQKTGQGSNN